MILPVLIATTHTNIASLQVLSTMAPKQDRTYARGRSKFVAPSARLIIRSDDERDPEYMPPSTSAPSRATRAPEPHPSNLSRPNFSSHEGTYYNPSVGKPNHNPEQHVMGVRVETKHD